MAEISSTRLLDALTNAGLEPVAQQRAVLEALEGVLAGDEIIVDASNPFAFVVELAITAPVNHINQNEVLNRRQYAALALTEDELYMHMSDRDFLNRFSQPSQVPAISLMLSLDEIKRFAVATGQTGVRKITIPKNTEFRVNDLVFTLEYPIDIRIMSHGGPAVGYGNVDYTPTHPLETNIVDWSVVNYQGQDMLKMMFSAWQMKITSQIDHLNSATVFNETYSFVDNFFFARVYIKNASGAWTEIVTTHTDLVFNPAKVTAMLKVTNNQLSVKIPQIYYSYGLMEGEIKVSIYTTKGVSVRYLGDYADTDWEWRWTDSTQEETDEFSAPIGLLSTIYIWSDTTTTGGRDALTFSQLRTRVIENNVSDFNIPITNVNLTRALSDLGYGAVTDVDALTNRVIWATKELPLTDDAGTVAPPSTVVTSLTAKIRELAMHSGVSDNGLRITLHPDILYKNDTGVVEVVGDSDLVAIRAMKPDAMARNVSAGKYLYTPFHYVFDASMDRFEARAYYLDDPVIDSRRFVEENDSLALELSAAQAITVTREAGGYRIHLLSRTGTSYRLLDDDQLQCQLAFVPVGEKTRAYLNGTLLGRQADGEILWEFFLETTWDLDSANSLYFTNFAMFSGSARATPTPLTTTFDLLYTVSNYEVSGMTRTDIDSVTNTYMLPYDAIGALHEQVTIGFGDALTYLWTGSRTITTSFDYETYVADTPLTYLLDVPKRDANGAIVFVNENGSLVPQYEYRRGDVVLDASGNTLYKGMAGDLIYDESGNPIPISERGLARMVDMFFIDGRYFFANTATLNTYMDYVVGAIRDRVTQEISDFNSKALEETKIYYRPQNTLGEVAVIVEEGREIYLESEQYFQILVYLSKEDHANEPLKEALRKTIASTLVMAMLDDTVSSDEIESLIRSNSGVATLGLRVTGMGGAKDYLTITNKDASGRLSIRKKLSVLPDNTFTVEDDIDVDFKRHLPSRTAN